MKTIPFIDKEGPEKKVKVFDTEEEARKNHAEAKVRLKKQLKDQSDN